MEVYGISGGYPVLARWTTDFDCGYETSWWHCIKDTPFNISALQSKKRYEVNKGKKNFCVKVIEPEQYAEEILTIQEKAWEQYPKAYRPEFNRSLLRKKIKQWYRYRVFGAFGVEDKMLHSFALITEHDDYANFAVLKTDPVYERQAINAAIVAGICEYYSDRLNGGFYITDGERNTVHETNFQDYLSNISVLEERIVSYM